VVSNTVKLMLAAEGGTNWTDAATGRWFYSNQVSGAFMLMDPDYDMIISNSSGTYSRTGGNMTLSGTLTASNIIGQSSVPYNRTGGAQFPSLNFNCWDYMTEAGVLAQVTNCMQNGWVANGFNTFVLDFGWALTNRDANGYLQSDPTLFPHGIPWLANTLHGLGCKLGIYVAESANPSPGSSAGQVTTSFADIPKDAALLASWGIDYVKADWSAGNDATELAWWLQWSSALDAACASNNIPRMYLEGVCNPIGGWGHASNWMPLLANSIRLCGDPVAANNHYGFWQENLVDSTRNPWLVGPGHTTYGNGVVTSGYPGASWWTTNDTRAMHALYAVAYQELSESATPSAITAQDGAMILANPEFTALMRDPLVTAGVPISTNGLGQVWTRPLANGDWLVCFWNQSTDSAVTLNCQLASLAGFPTNLAIVRDVFGRTSSAANWTITTTVAANGANLYRVSPSSSLSTLETGVSTPSGDLSTVSNLQVWFKGDAESFAPGTFTNWPDSSGHGINGIGAATNQAQFNVNVINGLPAYKFSNSSSDPSWPSGNYFSALATPYTATDTNFTAFIVFQFLNCGSSYAGILCKAQPEGPYYSGNGFLICCGGTCGTTPTFDARIRGIDAPQFALTPGAWYIACVMRNADTGYAFWSGASSNSWSGLGTGALDAFPLCLGGDPSAALGGYVEYPTDLNIAEVAYYNTNMAWSDKDKIMSSLRFKYGLP